MNVDLLISIIVALISGGASLLGVIITTNKSTSKMMCELEKQSIMTKAELEKQQIVYKSELDKNQAVMDNKISNLTIEMKECNNLGKKVPVIEEQIKVMNNRIKDLENITK